MIHPDEIALAILTILSLQSLYALVLFPMIWAMVKCFRGRYPRWQHALWLLILLRLVLPPDMAAPWSASQLIRTITPHAVPQHYLAVPYEFQVSQDNEKPFSGAISDQFVFEALNSSGGNTTVGSRWATVLSPVVLKCFRLVVCCAYFLIVTSLLVLFLRIRRRYWKIARQGKTVQDPAALEVARTWRRRLHIRRAIEVKAVVADVPAYTIGFFRPVIILPEHLIYSAGRAALESVIAHELVHVKRGDDFAICLQELVKIVYFFHPVVWFVMPRLTWTREAVCDGTVLSHGTLSPRTYGKQLIASDRDRSFSGQPSSALAVFTSAARGMAFRLNQIQKEGNMKSNPLIVYLTVLMLGLFILPMAPMASSDEAKTTERISDQKPSVAKNTLPSESVNNESLNAILNPFNSTCYDWRGEIIPCDFKRQYAELLLGKPIPSPRFIDNNNGTVTDTLTNLTWLKSANCFGMLDLRGAKLAVDSLKEGDRGLNSDFVLSDGSSAGDWRLPTMKELCTMIDFSKREPALPIGHKFSFVPQGYHWSATTQEYYSEMAWIVYFESGTASYKDIKNNAGYVWPVRDPLK